MTDLNTTIKADLTYLKTHLTLLVAVVVLAGGVVYGSESLIASHDSQREAKDSKVLALVMAQTADLKTRMVQDEQAATVRDAQYAAIIAQLSGTIAGGADCGSDQSEDAGTARRSPGTSRQRRAITAGSQDHQ